MTTTRYSDLPATPHSFFLRKSSFDVSNAHTPTATRAMSSSRTAALLSNLHSPHTTGIPSFCLYSCSTRSFSAYHVTSPKRSTRPRTRHSPISGSTIAFFSTSTRCQAREPNHYEVLDLPVTATAGEIKKYASPPSTPSTPSPSTTTQTQ